MSLKVKAKGALAGAAIGVIVVVAVNVVVSVLAFAAFLYIDNADQWWPWVTAAPLVAVAIWGAREGWRDAKERLAQRDGERPWL